MGPEVYKESENGVSGVMGHVSRYILYRQIQMVSKQRHS